MMNKLLEMLNAEIKAMPTGQRTVFIQKLISDLPEETKKAIDWRHLKRCISIEFEKGRLKSLEREPVDTVSIENPVATPADKANSITRDQVFRYFDEELKEKSPNERLAYMCDFMIKYDHEDFFVTRMIPPILFME